MIPHVLVVDDSALVVGALRLLLEETGHRVSSAFTVPEAIATARREQPDVMLLDVSLGDADGLTVLHTLTADTRAPRVTVAVTGHDDPAVRERCLRAGCVDVLVKPIAPLALPGQIGQWLDGARTREAGREGRTAERSGGEANSR